MHRSDGAICIETRSPYMTAQALVVVPPGAVSIAFFLRYDHAIARTIWSLVSPLHQRVVPDMLGEALTCAGVHDHAQGSA